ncbi:hypothetical protein ACJX0J_024353, partial [Zea mays]
VFWEVIMDDLLDLFSEFHNNIAFMPGHNILEGVILCFEKAYDKVSRRNGTFFYYSQGGGGDFLFFNMMMIPFKSSYFYDVLFLCWNTICQPKEIGGLGNKYLGSNDIIY